MASIGENTMMVEVVVPEDCAPGDSFLLDVGDHEVEITVPQGAEPGSVLRLSVPTAEEGQESSEQASLPPDIAEAMKNATPVPTPKASDSRPSTAGVRSRLDLHPDGDALASSNATSWRTTVTSWRTCASN
eukprot:TRINITY_DN114569_c0_g1_i1.p1 TRINITY_DN114569_c0_g1~~TRINITY_DN114569_c0_g1_i1.p1  ORF type:complete len:131 (+),score=18.19 TRINITY_DN114569_c0_g1_i1:50-442(+)